MVILRFLRRINPGWITRAGGAGAGKNSHAERAVALRSGPVRVCPGRSWAAGVSAKMGVSMHTGVDLTDRTGSTTAAAFADAVESGRLNLPLPGGGRTRERWAVLADLAGEDLSLARLAEGHADALAI